MNGKLAISRKEVEERFEDEAIDSVVIAAMLTMVIVVMLPLISQQVSSIYSRVQTLSMSPQTIAQNVGSMWYEITPLGQPNRLKMIGENSTGAFEEILLALST